MSSPRQEGLKASRESSVKSRSQFQAEGRVVPRPGSRVSFEDQQVGHSSNSGHPDVSRPAREASREDEGSDNRKSGFREAGLGQARGSRLSSLSCEARERGSFADQRVVYIGDPARTNEDLLFAGNKVRTSKYTLISFLPRNLFEQFHRLAYVYFLLIVILNQIPQLAVFGRLASLFPLLFVLVVTALKDGYEDWGRHRSDRIENNRTSLVLREGRFEQKKWKKIEPGEVVKLHQNESIPCDIVLLSTSDPSGVAYLQTINLDGETNLKTRYARQETASKHPSTSWVSGQIVAEPPNRNIYEFVAYMELEGVQVPLTSNNIILRGCVLKNTSWVVGVVVYAGKETKALLNSSGAQSKRSRLEQHMNRETLWLSLFLLVICIIGGIGMEVWLYKHGDELDSLSFYKKKDTSSKNFMYYGPFGEGIFAFLSFIIMFQIMIPISLYISMELVRLGQSYFMVRDIEMFHAPTNSRFQCRALNINEDLGQIKYVFSDKTGTLTENRMIFHSASISGVDYSSDTEPSQSNEPLTELQTEDPDSKTQAARIDDRLKQLLSDEGEQRASSDHLKFIHEFMLVLAACNTVIPIRTLLPSELMKAHVEYQAESPDEQALVAAAAAYGYTLLERSSSTILIDVHGAQHRYKIIGIHEFDSVRKRMSVVVECPDNTFKVLVKGADTGMMDIVGKDTICSSVDSNTVLAATKRHLTEYSVRGLRTLVIAYKELEGSELENWHEQYKVASTALVDRVGMLRAAASTVERDLVLLGATAIEDKLQEGVPETISALRDAGIKVWVLTGDKQETAISIGFSSSLLTDGMEQIVINAGTRKRCSEALRRAIDKYGLVPEPDLEIGEDLEIKAGEMEIPEGYKPETNEQLALVIDGNSLVHALSPELESYLFALAAACKVVICCRVAPLQKAGIVSLMKRKTKDMTLAIGDGANDVSMIQTADVGVGLSGQEGRQAVMASDFALGQFRFIRRLLLVHGHWNYQRLAYMVLYNFYRNAVFVMMLFWYILHTAFSAQTALFDWNLMFYSLVYTSVPTIVVAILDKDVSHRTLLKFPPLYGVGQRDESYNAMLFWATMLDTMWQSLVLFYVPFFSYQASSVDIWGLGCLWAAAVVVLVNLHLTLDVQHWTWITHLAIWGSIAVSFACFLVLDALTDEAFISHYRVSFHMMSTAGFWLNILLIVVIALLPRFCAKVVAQKFCPSDVRVARELELKQRRDKPTKSAELDDVPYPSTNESEDDE